MSAQALLPALDLPAASRPRGPASLPRRRPRRSGLPRVGRGERAAGVERAETAPVATGSERAVAVARSAAAGALEHGSLRHRSVDRGAIDEINVEYRETGVREILHRVRGRRLPYAWSLNPYRGCEVGRTHCPMSDGREFLGLGHWRDFDRLVFVKRDAGEALERQLAGRSFHGQPIALGTATDPYQPAEERFGVTRKLLRAFGTAEGLELTIGTRSPLILRDLELLERLDQRHSISIHLAVPTADRQLAHTMEPHAAAPEARLEAAGRLAAAGLTVILEIAPLLPEINDRRSQLEPLFEAAARRGVDDVRATPLVLSNAARERFEPWLAAEFPRLVPRYARLYGRRAHLSKAHRERLIARLRLLRMLHGFPRQRTGRA